MKGWRISLTSTLGSFHENFRRCASLRGPALCSLLTHSLGRPCARHNCCQKSPSQRIMMVMSCAPLCTGETSKPHAPSTADAAVMKRARECCLDHTKIPQVSCILQNTKIKAQHACFSQRAVNAGHGIPFPSTNRRRDGSVKRPWHKYSLTTDH